MTAPPDTPNQEGALLHRGGRDGSWGNLGLWDGAADYAGACAALARAVGRAAAIAPRDRVLSVACGAGDELLLWAREFAAGAVIGTEIDAASVRTAQRLVMADPRITVHLLSGSIRLAEAFAAGSFDRVLCVDAAYHLSPRADFFRAAHRLLRPGGRLAHTDLMRLDESPAHPLVRRAAYLCGIDAAEVRSAAAIERQLQAAGFVDIRIERLDERVLAGFARFVARQSLRLGRDALGAGWRRPALTALLLAARRAAGLGYGLISAAATA